MPSIIEDLVAQQPSLRVDKNGTTTTRVLCVSGLPESSATLYLAATATDDVTGATVPQYGQPHPVIPNCFVTALDVIPWAGNSRTACRVTATYGWWSYAGGASTWRIRGSSASLVVQANRDQNGKIYSVSYTDQKAAEAGSSNATGKNMVLINELKDHLVLEFTAILNYSPKMLASQYVGRVNSDPGWQQMGDDTHAYNWLCRGIDWEQTGNASFQTTFKFEYAPEGWSQFEFYRDPATGQIPADIMGTKLYPFGGPPDNPNEDGDPNGPIAGPKNNVAAIWQYTPATAVFGALGLPLA